VGGAASSRSRNDVAPEHKRRGPTRDMGHELSQTGAKTNGGESQPRRGGTQVVTDA
jgi:hypothetical protein